MSSNSSMNNLGDIQQIRDREMTMRRNNRNRRREAKSRKLKENQEVLKGKRMSGVSRVKAEVKEKMESYKDYCERLNEAYLAKHQEIEDATNKIKNIKDNMERITRDVLINLREVEDYNSSNNESLDDDTEELLRELKKILEDIPDTTEANQKLSDLISRQATLTEDRNTNNRNIEGKINAIRSRLQDLGTDLPTDRGGGLAIAANRRLPATPTGSAFPGAVEGMRKMKKSPRKLSKKKGKKKNSRKHSSQNHSNRKK